MSILITILAFLLTLGILITFHEFGHFWVARKLGVKVLRFSVGFGKPLWSRTAKDGTEYCVAVVPLGGYVKMLDEREGTVAPDDLPYAFNRKSVWARIAIVLAGPVFNFIFAVFAFAAVYAIGTKDFAPIIDTVTVNSVAEQIGIQPADEVIAINGRKVNTQQHLVREFLRDSDDQGYTLSLQRGDTTQQVYLPHSRLTVSILDPEFFQELGMSMGVPAWIGQVVSDSAAERAGLQAGDHVIAVDGQGVQSWVGFVQHIATNPQQPVTITVWRNNQAIDLVAIPDVNEQNGVVVGHLGVYIDDDLLRTTRYNVLAAMGRGSADTFLYSVLTLKMIGKMLMGQVGLEHISGPVSIAVYAGESAQIGLTDFLQFLALISISLGVLNLLPIPMLDGGHLLYYVIEIIRGKPVSLKVQQIGFSIGLLLLVSLMTLAFYNDFIRLGVQ